VDDNATLVALGVAIEGNGDCGIGFGQGINRVQTSNLILRGNERAGICGPYTKVATTLRAPASVTAGFAPQMTHALGYIPGDAVKDTYPYVYPDDETRRIVRKIGRGLGLTWSLAWDGEHLWTSTLLGQVSKLEPVTGKVLKQFAAPGPQPWGMTFDGSHLWIVDFAERRISKVAGDTGKELASFPTPDPLRGCKGVTWDGSHLCILSRRSSVIYKMDRRGNLVDTVRLDSGGGGGIAWDGKHFWVPDWGKIRKYDPKGRAVGWVYGASEGTWDLTWDGKYLWAAQRTNENWMDAKIYALEVLEDHED
jgi:hypothetical protein